VGGDWYDCIELPDGRFSLIVGDVMGQGIRAAALMSKLRDSTRILVSVDPSPTAVLDGLNEVVLSAATDQIATVAYVLVDPEALRVTIGLAGHLPPVLVPHGANAVAIGQAGASPLLGLETRNRPEASVSVDAGSALILFTDGLVEDRTGVADGMTRLLSEATKLAARGNDSELLASALLEIGQSAEQADDIALLVARLLPHDRDDSAFGEIP
jgi:serine phosphatase RsbU (regulator of sigma subunit)